MDQEPITVVCDRCGRHSSLWQERGVHTAWHHNSGKHAQPQSHRFRICRRCLRIGEGGNTIGQFLFLIGILSFGSWLLNWPGFFWRWDKTALRGHGSLGAQLTLGLTAIGIVIWASFSLSRWLKKRALDALPAATAPGWAPEVITPEKYDDMIRKPEASTMDADGLVNRTTLSEGRCEICKQTLADPAVHIVLRTGREMSNRVTDVQRIGNTLTTTSLKTYGEIEDCEIGLCPSCWVDRRRKMRKAAISLAFGFPLFLIASLFAIIFGVEAPLLGFGLVGVVFVGGLIAFVQLLKGLQARHPMAVLEKRVTENRNSGKKTDAFKVIATTWPLPRRRSFE